MAIRRIDIKGYRGLAEFTWLPAPGINCLIGPGDSGKSTVLSAISLLLSPIPNPQVSEFDYHRRRVGDGFEITAVLGDLGEEIDRALRIPSFHGWRDGRLHEIPDEEGAEKVLVVRVSGSPELEVSHEIVAPSGDTSREFPFRVDVRRLCRHAVIASGSRAARELGLTRGSLLEQFVGDVDVRASVAMAVSGATEHLKWPAEVTEALAKLRKLFDTAALPSALHLGILPGQDRSLVTLVGLLAGEPREESVPLTLAGSGTRQAVMFQLAAALLDRAAILTIDEPETALEPYRQRALIAELRRLIGERGQAFVTTHSPAIIGSVGWGGVSRLAPGGSPVQLKGGHLKRLFDDDPDAFLARLPVLCEGPTEVGLLSVLLPYVAAADPGILDVRGIHLANGRGNRSAIDLANELLDLGLKCGAFIDNEVADSGRRELLRQRMGPAFTAWADYRNIEHAVARTLPVSSLAELLRLAASLAEQSESDFIQQVREKAGRPGRGSVENLVSEIGESEVRVAFAEAMDKCKWFKDVPRGTALAKFLIRVGVPDPIRDVARTCWTGLDATLA